MLYHCFVSAAGLLIVIVVAAILLACSLVVAFVLACAMLVICQAIDGKFLLLARIEGFIAWSQKATRCHYVVPPLMGYLGMQFGAWDWELVSRCMFGCHCYSGGYVAHLWKEQKQKQLFLRRHKVWRKGRGKGKGNGRGDKGNSRNNSSGRYFRNYR